MSARIVPRIAIINAMLVSTNVDGTGDPAAYAAGTTYGQDTAAVPVMVQDPVTHLVYRSRVANNTGNTPATSPTQWQVVGFTNAWRMFGTRTSVQTARAEVIDVQLKVGEPIDSLTLLNTDATLVQVTQTDPVDGVVFDTTYLMVDTEVADYDEYFFSPVVTRDRLLVTGLAPYASSTIRLQIKKPGGTAACAACLVGLSQYAGQAKWGIEMGIDDFSLKNVSQYGEAALQPGDYADNLNLTAYVPRARSTAFAALLKRQRAKPLLIVGDDTLPDTALYGWIESWRRTFEYLQEDVYTLSFKGLT
ncbi:hypothetical protein [uncultured Xylophilus sp.]|uniref:hypothetical protein n=1 Tax=uncultured Xylophilus sp. TaxID=296832 RepID=UPI0025DC82B5|nr:hypothetical protein [uncultured Xylophilus sp.]